MIFDDVIIASYIQYDKVHTDDQLLRISVNHQSLLQIHCNFKDNASHKSDFETCRVAQAFQNRNRFFILASRVRYWGCLILSLFCLFFFLLLFYFIVCPGVLMRKEAVMWSSLPMKE